MQLAAGGGGGHVVGIAPGPAEGLAGAMSQAAGRATITGWRTANLLTQAGADAAGATTPDTLHALTRWLATAQTDLRWRMALLAEGGLPISGGVLLGVVPFASAAAARSAGARFAEDLDAALQLAVYGEGDEAREAMDRYFSLAGAVSVYAHDPAWAGGLIDTLGADGITNVVWFAMTEVEGDVDETHQLIAPVAAALATAMRARTVSPAVGRELLQEPNYRLGVLLTAAPPATDFLVEAARSRFVDAAWSADLSDDLHADEAEFFLDALSADAEAAYRVLTARGPAGEHGASDILRLLPSLGSDEAERFAGLALERGLVGYPATRGAPVWNKAVDTTQDVVRFSAHLGWAFDDMDPGLSTSMLRLLHPHLDAVAGIGIESSGIETDGYDVAVELPDGRRSFDVPPEDLREFLGGVLQHDESIGAMQAALAAYTQADTVQANRMPLISADGRVSELKPFLADSMRIAGLMGMVGQGLDIAGHDEESRTKVLTGALQFASSKGIGKMIGWTGPLGWAAKETAGRGADWATDQFRNWVATFEPVEGESGIDALLDAYDRNTEASLRDQMARDPIVSALPAHEQDEMVAHAVRISGDMVRANLLEVYAELTGETAKESK